MVGRSSNILSFCWRVIVLGYLSKFLLSGGCFMTITLQIYVDHRLKQAVSCCFLGKVISPPMRMLQKPTGFRPTNQKRVGFFAYFLLFDTKIIRLVNR